MPPPVLILQESRIQAGPIFGGQAKQCKASQDFYDDLVKQYGEDDFETLAEKFASFTGTSKFTARNRISFLRWPKDVKEYVYMRGGYWYVVEIEDKIIRPALQNYPEYFAAVDVDDVRRDLFKKYQAGLVKAAVEVRVARVVASHAVAGDKREKAKDILHRLIHDTGYLFSDARDEFVQEFPDADERRTMTPYSLVNAMRGLAETLKSYDPEYVRESSGRYSTEPEVFKHALEELAQAADDLLEQLS